MKKVCTKCGEEKESDAFHSRKDSKDGKRSQCKVCTNKRNLQKYHTSEETREQHHKASRKHNLKERYGITPEDYDRILEEQGGVCKICGGTDVRTSGGRKAKFFCVDHCHSTGKVRGLLCHGCNVGLGAFKDSSDFLLRAINYLEGT